LPRSSGFLARSRRRNFFSPLRFVFLLFFWNLSFNALPIFGKWFPTSPLRFPLFSFCEGELRWFSYFPLFFSLHQPNVSFPFFSPVTFHRFPYSSFLTPKRGSRLLLSPPFIVQTVDEKLPQDKAPSLRELGCSIRSATCFGSLFSDLDFRPR